MYVRGVSSTDSCKWQYLNWDFNIERKPPKTIINKRVGHTEKRATVKVVELEKSLWDYKVIYQKVWDGGNWQVRNRTRVGKRGKLSISGSLTQALVLIHISEENYVSFKMGNKSLLLVPTD